MVQARSGPRVVATDTTPAAASRSRSARALAIARAAPATTAAGTRIANDPGTVPAAPSQPKTGSSGIPTANGQPRPGGALREPVVAIADGQDGDRERQDGQAGRHGEEQADGGRDDHPDPGGGRRYESGGDGLARLVTGVVGRVDHVVEDPDRGLEGRHGETKPNGRRRVGTGQRGEGRRRDPVEQRRERMGQADESAEATRDR